MNDRSSRRTLGESRTLGKARRSARWLVEHAKAAARGGGGGTRGMSSRRHRDTVIEFALHRPLGVESGRVQLRPEGFEPTESARSRLLKEKSFSLLTSETIVG
jgi:hypothetical protein